MFFIHLFTHRYLLGIAEFIHVSKMEQREKKMTDLYPKGQDV